MPPEVKALDDYELYDWRRADINNADDKKMIENYFAWDGEFPAVGKAVNQGKIFK